MNRRALIHQDLGSSVAKKIKITRIVHYRGGSRNLKLEGVLFIVVVSWSFPTTPTFYCFLGKRANFENNRRTPLDPLVHYKILATTVWWWWGMNKYSRYNQFIRENFITESSQVFHQKFFSNMRFFIIVFVMGVTPYPLNIFIMTKIISPDE